LRPFTRTSFHHQPEAQHPKSSAIHNIAGRLPHLCAINGLQFGFEGEYCIASHTAVARKAGMTEAITLAAQ
jgi:hypothetical protein